MSDPMVEKISQVVIEFCLFYELDPYERQPNGLALWQQENLREEAIRQMAWYAAITKCIRSHNK